MRFYPKLFGLFLIVCFGCFAGTLSAESWRSELYPRDWSPPTARDSFEGKLIQDFSYAGYRRGEAEIPKVTGPIFDVREFGAEADSETDSTRAIQAAIDAAGEAGGGVVQFRAGTYRIQPQEQECLLIDRYHVVLRGAADGTTFLLNTSPEMRNKRIIRFKSKNFSKSGYVPFSQDTLGPTRRIFVRHADRFKVGDRVLIGWDFTEEWIAEHGQSDYWNAEKRPGSALYHREILKVNAEAGWVEIDIPTRYKHLRRDGARMGKVSGMLRGCGIENLRIGNVEQPLDGWDESDFTVEGTGAYAAHDSWALEFRDAVDCWVTDVDSFQPEGNRSGCHILSNGILLSQSTRITVRSCSFQRPQYGGGGGNGYLLRLANTSESLVDQFEAAFSRHGIVLSQAWSSGNVFYRCVDRETGKATGSSGMYATGGRSSDNHMHFSHSNLFDNCMAEDSSYSATHRRRWGGVPHALTAAQTVYWNTEGRASSRINFCVESKQGGYGYVIGTRGTAWRARVELKQEDELTTAPEDHVEGLGEGASLEPASLYRDQLRRRLDRRL